MNNPKQILWTDLNSEPPKNYLWQKKDGIYSWINNTGWKKIMSSNGSDSGGGPTPEPTPEPTSSIGFPFCPSKLIGFVEYEDLRNPELYLIEPDKLKEYLKNKNNGEDAEGILIVPIYEYDENLIKLNNVGATEPYAVCPSFSHIMCDYYKETQWGPENWNVRSYEHYPRNYAPSPIEINGNTYMYFPEMSD